jgi:lipopolysaccharide export LptBFGC system permease protein LptF
MKTLQFYAFKELIAPFLVSAGFFVFALMVLRLFDLSRLLLNAGVSIGIVGQVLLIILGTLITLTIPMAILLATIIGIGRLASENEILAMRASGVHLARVFYPIVIVAFVISLGLMAVGQFVIPGFFQRLTQLSTEAQFNLLSNLKPGVIYPSIGNAGSQLSIYYEQRPEGIEPEPGVLQMNGVTIRLSVQGGAVSADSNPTPGAEGATEQFMISAQSGRIIAREDSQQLELHLDNGSMIPLPRERSRRTTVLLFDNLVNKIDTELDISRRNRDTAREQKFPELFQMVANPPENEIWNDDQYGLRIFSNWRLYFAARNEMIQRFTVPLACVAFVLVAIPLAIEIRPRAKAFAFLIAAALLMAYYFFLTMASTLGASGSIDASPLSWILLVLIFMSPNFLLGGAGIFLFWRAMSR